MQADFEIVDLVEEDSASPSADVYSLSPAAALEFQATLQLLAERARFLTAAGGVAIALQEDGQLRYAAVTGDSTPDAGDPVDDAKEYIAKCLKDQKSVCAAESPCDIAVPIIQNGHLVGIFELTNASEFDAQAVAVLERLADMVTIAMDHRDAAARAEKRVFGEPPQEKTELPKSSLSRTVWHAPESIASQSSEAAKPAGKFTAPLRTCSSCGFPVSPGRTLCVDCDKRADAHDPPTGLFNSLEQESWLSAHAYTVATALVSVLTAAVIYWLR